MQKKPPFINIIIAALLALLTVLIGLLSGIAPNELPSAVTPYLRLTWPLLGIATLVFAGLIILQTALQSDNSDKPIRKSERPQQSIEKQNRQRLLAKVRNSWIHGVLEQSLYGQALIALGLRQHSDVLENPLRFVLQVPNQPAQQLPAGTRIIEVFDKALGELLILGEPGSGKTTLLLEMTRNLLDRAESDGSHPVPLVFNLSSWAVKQQSLDDWLVEEINTKYQVPRLLAQAWIDSDQVLPLLDGLDEVARDARDGCVQAINASRLKHGLVPLVVCSRSAEYMALSSYVQLRTAVTVLPLTLSQIDTYLSQAGGKLAAVEIALHEDPILQELAKAPLMLNILIVTYVGKSTRDLLVEDSLEARGEQFSLPISSRC